MEENIGLRQRDKEQSVYKVMDEFPGQYLP